jgi:hypothetical protein
MSRIRRPVDAPKRPGPHAEADTASTNPGAPVTTKEKTGMVVSTNRKSGKGLGDGVVSELTVVFTITPGHEEQVRAACKHLMDVIRDTDARATEKSGLRDARLVMFDDDRRLLLTTNFETEWDVYIDDVITAFGIENWSDLLQHLVDFDRQTLGGNSARAKQALQTHQVPATSYWHGLSDKTVPEIRKALRLEDAFQQVLDDPAGAQALQHSALKPLLEQAAD